MKRIEFYADTNRSGNVLHIETDGCVVNIRVGLTDAEGRRVTNVQVLPEDESRGGDGLGHVWDADGMTGVRVIRREAPAGEPG